MHGNQEPLGSWEVVCVCVCRGRGGGGGHSLTGMCCIITSLTVAVASRRDSARLRKMVHTRPNGAAALRGALIAPTVAYINQVHPCAGGLLPTAATHSNVKRGEDTVETAATNVGDGVGGRNNKSNCGFGDLPALVMTSL